MYHRKHQAVGTAFLLSLAVSSPSPAWALNGLDFLDWACGGGGVASSSITDELLSDCAASAQPDEGKSVCEVLSGTPFACNDSQVDGPSKTSCRFNRVTLTATGQTGAYLGWQVSGSVTITGTIHAYKKTETCTLTPLSPTPTGDAGTYVAEAGTAWVVARFTAGGTGKIKFLGATVFGVSFKKTCEDSMSEKIFSEGSTAACEAVKKADRYDGSITPSGRQDWSVRPY